MQWVYLGYEECGNLKVVIDGEELIRNTVMTERIVQKFYKPIDVNSVINAIDEIEVSMIFLAITFFEVDCK